MQGRPGEICGAFLWPLSSNGCAQCVYSIASYLYTRLLFLDTIKRDLFCKKVCDKKGGLQGVQGMERLLMLGTYSHVIAVLWHQSL